MREKYDQLSQFSEGAFNSMKTATPALESDIRNDRRKHEVLSIGHAIFSEIRDLLPRDVESEVHERIMAALHQNGVLLVRDDERLSLGLESCDEMGWTPSELVEFEQDRVDAMLQMIHMQQTDVTLDDQ